MQAQFLIIIISWLFLFLHGKAKLPDRRRWEMNLISARFRCLILKPGQLKFWILKIKKERKMKINDTLYGEERINEKVLIELINSNPVQRLKKLNQWGIPEKYYHKKKGFSRYEHSIGVLVLLRKLGADLSEQVAGLLHDVSHTAFSHVGDWVIGDLVKEDYQDKTHISFIRNSEIPSILERNNFSYIQISNIEDFSLLEREAPSLCADRIDYALRD